MLVDLKAPAWATHFLSDLTDWQKGPVPVAQMRPFNLPDDAYFEYAYQDAAGERRPDPDNPNPRLNPWWTYACNLTGPDNRPHPLAGLAGVRPRGRVLRLEIESRLLEESRRLMVYSPAGQADSVLPVILFQDGKAYYGWGKVPLIMDRLLEDGLIRPAHLVFLPPRRRTPEYAFNAVYRQFIVVEVLQELEGRIACSGERVAWGASLGGLLSAQLAWENPHLFQKVVTQSGAFLFSEDMDLKNPFAGGESFRKQVLDGPSRDIAWHLDCGTLEWLAPSNRNLHAALEEKGARASLVLRSAGHNWTNWRNGIPEGLLFALGQKSLENRSE
jgi:enterochelin esterase-like enzyme